MIAWWVAAAWAGTCTVFEGADAVYTPDGPRSDVTVVVADGRFAAVGAVAVERAGAEARWAGRTCGWVDARGRQLTPGLIEANGQIGLLELDLEPATHDDDGGGDPIRAALRVADGYDPDSVVVDIQRVAGVTGEVTHPSGGLVSGQAAYVQLWGDSQAETVVAPSVAVDVQLRASASRAQDWSDLSALLDDAATYRAQRAAYDRGATRELAGTRLDLEALIPVLDRRVPLVVGADRAPDIEALLRFQRQFGVRVVLRGGAEAWRWASALAAAQIPVIVDPTVVGPGSVDQIAGRADNAAILAAAGVPVVISTFGTHNARNLRQYAGNAWRAGLGHDAAVRAITQAPADAFGLADRGRIAVGAVADLVLWNGDPLELSTWATEVWVAGAATPLVSRQTLLRDRYRTLPGTPAPALPLPK
jgi:imidazolonepropionase-like amidohydrolase